MHGIRAMLSRRAWLVLVVVTAGVLGSAGVASAANTYTVNDPNDAPLANPSGTTCVSTDPGPNNCTLRAAVQAADNAGGQSTISLPANTYKMTIAPSGNTNDPSTGDLDVDNGASVTITGAGSGSTVVNANSLDRAFAVQPGASLTLSGMTIENGVSSTYEPNRGTSRYACYDDNYTVNYGTCGGAIYSDGALAVTADVVFNNNTADNFPDFGNCDYCYASQGGAIYADNGTASQLSLAGATFTNNSATDDDDCCSITDYSTGGAVADNSPAAATISGSTFTNNTAIAGGALFQSSNSTTTGLAVTTSTFSGNAGYEGGGAVWGDSGPMNFDKSTFSSNVAYDGGVFMWDAASTSDLLTVTNSTMENNSANGDGVLSAWDYFNCAGAPVTMNTSRFVGNSGFRDDGVMDVEGDCATTTLTLNGDEFDGNTSPNGVEGVGYLSYTDLTATGTSFVGNSSKGTSTEGTGGFWADGGDTLNLTNVTMSQNSSTTGGALFIDANTTASFANVTIDGNSASVSGGGISGASYLQPGASPAGLLNTVIANNKGGDCSAIPGSSSTSYVPSGADAGNNLDSNSSCFGYTGHPTSDKPGVNPLLAAAADNGGPTAGAPGSTETLQTQAETAGSPAIDAGNNTGCPGTDERGVPRPQGAACDIGAYESQAAGLKLTKSAPSTASTGIPFSYTLTTTNGGPGTSTGTMVTDQLPANTTLYGVSASQGTCTSAGSPAKVTCSLGRVDNGGTATATIVVAVTSPGTVTNSATATNDEGSSSTSSATTVVSQLAPAGSKPTATTGAAKAIKAGSAKLTGSVSPGNQVTAYFFQYGTTRSYGNISAVAQTGTTAKAVALAIRNLRGATRYHYRLVAVNSAGTAYGGDRTFKTKRAILGRLLLIGHTVKVKNGGLSATFKCASSRACFGLFSVTTRVRVAKTHRLVTIVCTKSRFAKYRIRAHKTTTVTVPVHQACVSYAQAHGGRLKAKVSTRPRTAQRGLVKLVSLVLG